LWLSVIAYNLGNLWRRLGAPKRIDTWSLTSLQQRGRLVKHARYYWLLLAEDSLCQGGRGRRWQVAVKKAIWNGDVARRSWKVKL